MTMTLTFFKTTRQQVNKTTSLCQCLRVFNKQNRLSYRNYRFDKYA